jgi:hypothetical protein
MTVGTNEASHIYRTDGKGQAGSLKHRKRQVPRPRLLRFCPILSERLWRRSERGRARNLLGEVLETARLPPSQLS